MIKVYMIIHRYFGCEKYFFDRVYKVKLSKVNSTARLCGGIYSCMSRV